LAPDANNVDIAMLSFLDDKGFRAKGCLVGLDTEWNPFDGTSDFTQRLALSIEGLPVYLFNLTEMKVQNATDFPDHLKKLLEDSRIIACGRNIGVDPARIAKLEIVVRHQVELRDLALEVDPSMAKTGFADLTLKLFKVCLDKGPRTMDWSICPLPLTMQKYAALDGLVSRLLGRLLMRMARQIPLNVDSKQVGHTVEIHIARKVVAKGKLLLVGGQHGIAQRWGTMTIGKGKALTRVSNVLVPGQRPPFDYVHESNDSRSWKKNEVTLGDRFDAVYVMASPLRLHFPHLRFR
jgi:hypothetical protein